MKKALSGECLATFLLFEIQFLVFLDAISSVSRSCSIQKTGVLMIF